MVQPPAGPDSGQGQPLDPVPERPQSGHPRADRDAAPCPDRAVRGVAVAGRDVLVGRRAEARLPDLVRRHGGVRGRELRLHVAADRSVPRLAALLRDRGFAGGRELSEQDRAGRQPDGGRDAVPDARRRRHGRRADRHGTDGGLADQRRDPVRAAGPRRAGDPRRGHGRPGPGARRLARRGGVRAAGRRRRGAAAARQADRVGRPCDPADPQRAAAPPPTDGRSGRAADPRAGHRPGHARRPVGAGDPALGGQRRVRLPGAAGGARRLGRDGRGRRWSCSPTWRPWCWG